METAGRPTYSPDNYYTSQSTVVHEQAHQWFGNTVTASNASDMWIHEGFATYLENVESAERRGLSLDDVVHGQYVTDGWSKGHHGQFDKVPLADPGNRFLLNTTPYFRGQAAVHALRHTLGEDDFWAVLRELASTAAGTTSDSQQLVQRAEDLSGTNLTDWAQTWLYSTGYQALPVSPSHEQVLREIGPGLLDAVSDHVWQPRSSARAALEEASQDFSPMNHLIINSVRRVEAGGERQLWVDFQTRESPLYPDDYRTCFVFTMDDETILAGSYLGVSLSATPKKNHFTRGACP
jgi:hypothetical protein